MKLEHFDILLRDDGSLWELGRGAMGVTYKAWDTHLHCAVALKLIHPAMLDSENARERFLREARAAAQLRHSNIATALHLGKTDDGGLFYVMEFCDGPTLHQAVAERGTFAARDAVEVALQIARALVAAESQYIVHRDIKPSNLILTESADQGLLVKVIDFGLARSVTPSAVLSYATIGTGGFMGTVHYASPEQLDEQEVDIRSDFYSLGVCLWFMLTGKPVFDGPMARVMAQALSSEPPWDVLASHPTSVVTLLRHLLAKDAADRPPDARSLREMIEACFAALGASSGSGRRSTALLPPPPTAKPPLQRVEDLKYAPHRSATAQSRRAVPEAAQQDHILGCCLATAEIERDALGIVLEGTDTRTGEPVRIRLCDASVMAVPQIRRRYAELVRGLLDHPHPALTKVLGCGEHAGEWAVICAPLKGVSALDVLKTRGRLAPSEALDILEPVAAALAHAQTYGFDSLEPQLQTIRIESARTPGREASLLSIPLSSWADYRITVDAIALTPDLAAETQGTLTSMPTRAAPAQRASTNKGARSSGAIVATLLYELLGGTAPARGTYAPLPRLNESANHLLREAMQGRQPNAAILLAEIRKALGSEINAPAPPSTRPSAQRSKTAYQIDRRSLASGLIAFVTLIALGGGWFLWHRQQQEEQKKMQTERAEQADIEHRKMIAETKNKVDEACNQALTLRKLGRYHEAHEVYSGTLETSKAILGTGHAKIIMLQNHLVTLQQELKDDTLAGEDMNLAAELVKNGLFLEAFPKYQAAYSLYNSILGSEHPKTLSASNGLTLAKQSQDAVVKADNAFAQGVILIRQEKLIEAQTMFQDASIAYEQTLGLGHQKTINARDHLLTAREAAANQRAQMLSQAQKIESEKKQKEDLLRLETDRKSAIEFEVLANLSQTTKMFNVGKNTEIENLCQQCIAKAEPVLGFAHPSMLKAHNELGVALLNQGKASRAEVEFYNVLNAKKNTLGVDHPATLVTWHNYGLALAFQGQLNKAETELRALLSAREKVLGLQHENTIATRAALNNVLTAQRTGASIGPSNKPSTPASKPKEPTFEEKTKIFDRL